MATRTNLAAEVMSHGLRQTQDGKVYLSILCMLRDGRGVEAVLYFSKASAALTMKAYGWPSDPRCLDPRAGDDFVSLRGSKILLQVPKEEGGLWFLASPSGSPATKEKIEQLQAALGVK